jgi:hypothetical protein
MPVYTLLGAVSRRVRAYCVRAVHSVGRPVRRDVSAHATDAMYEMLILAEQFVRVVSARLPGRFPRRLMLVNSAQPYPCGYPR